MREPTLTPNASPVVRNIFQRMRAKGMNAKNLSERAGQGADYLRDLFRGKTQKPSIEALTAIAAVLDCKISDLLDGGSDSGGSDSLQQQPPDVTLPIEIASNRDLLLQLWEALSDREQAVVVRYMLGIIRSRRP